MVTVPTTDVRYFPKNLKLGISGSACSRCISTVGTGFVRYRKILCDVVN